MLFNLIWLLLDILELNFSSESNSLGKIVTTWNSLLFCLCVDKLLDVEQVGHAVWLLGELLEADQALLQAEREGLL